VHESYSSYLPFPQVAVKAFRFRFAIDGDSNDRSAKVTHHVHNQKYDLSFLVDAPSRARNLEETRSQQCRSVPGHCIWVWNAWRNVLGVIMDA
jgi:hypothetical protein